jgi:dipeptidyl aminopeptidase/acylaminoacyl peptidase
MELQDEKLLAYLNVKFAEQSQSIPGRNKITFISKMRNLPQAWTLDEDRNPVQFGEFKDRVMSVNHSPQGNMAVIGMDYEGNEKQQLYLVTEDDDYKQTVLVEEPEYFHHFGGWSPNGESIAFSSNRRHSGYFDVFIMNIMTQETKKVFEYDGNCLPVKWLPDGEHILINLPETNIDQAIYILNIFSGIRTRLGDEDKRARYQSVELTKDGKGGYILTDLAEETLFLSQFSFDQPNHFKKLIHDPTWDIEEISLSPDETTIAYTLNEGGISRLFTYNVKEQNQSIVKSIPNGVINSLSWLDNDQCIFTLKSPTLPGDIWSLRLSNYEVERLTYFSHSDEVGDLWIEPEIYTFTSFDELNVPYFYYEKEDGKTKPAVIWVHGGPESQIRAEYNPVIQYLVNQGFAVAAPNVRGSRGYGRTYIKLDDVRKRMDSVKDLAWLSKDLVQSHGADKDRIGIMGRSYGGFMVLAALTHYPDLWAAGVNIVGISHFKTFLENTGAWRRRLREYEYGSLKSDADFFEEIAPLNHSHKIKAPLLVFHGKNDTRVPVSEAEQLVRDMEMRGQEVSLTVFPDEGHQTVRLENHITMNSEIVRFMNGHLQDGKMIPGRSAVDFNKID